MESAKTHGNDPISIKAPSRHVPGGFWRRFVASLLDGLIMGVILMPISILIQLGMVALQDSPGLMILISYGVQFTAVYFYYGYFYCNKGATPGKMVLGLRVINSETGTNLTYWRAFFRETIGKFISALPLMLGFIIAGIREDKKGFHDMLLSTQVLHEKED